MSESWGHEVLIECASCGTPLHLRSGVTMSCPRCASVQTVEALPAFYRKPEAGRSAELLVAEGEASCFYHAQKKAVVACEECGRFLCGLCEVEFGGRRLCPACIEAGKSKSKITALETRRMLYDDLAQTLAAGALIVAWMPIINMIAIGMSLATLYYSIRYWKTPTSILPRTRVRFVLASLVALVALVIAGLMDYSVLRDIFRYRH